MSEIETPVFKKEKDNGKDNDIPPIMTGDNKAVELIEAFRNDALKTNRDTSWSKYLVMEGMQNKDKIDFFTEFVNDDDVLRMNTIQMYIDIAPLIIRKTSEKNMLKIKTLLNGVYALHVMTHKTNMVSKNRKREDSYNKILSSDSSDSGIPSSGFKKFFGVNIGGNGKK